MTAQVLCDITKKLSHALCGINKTPSTCLRQQGVWGSTSLHWYYSDVTMSMMASQIMGITTVHSTVCSSADQRNIKAPCHWPLWREFTVINEFPAQRTSNAEEVSIWWNHHGATKVILFPKTTTQKKATKKYFMAKCSRIQIANQNTKEVK